MKIFVTGGAGYVGSLLVPDLIRSHHQVTVYDLMLYGNPFNGIDSDNLRIEKGDIRDREALIKSSDGADVIIHLASISNDPSFELNPELGKSINLDATHNVVDAARNSNRLIFASSASVYGIQDTPVVTEDTEPNPQTDYAKYKLEAESIFSAVLPQSVMVRCATICGYAPRLRLDLVVNIFTSHAIINDKIRIFGGSQHRPNINVLDVVRAYSMLLDSPDDITHGEVFNVGAVNMSLDDIAKEVVKNVPKEVTCENVPTDDTRSYFINSDKIYDKLGFKPIYSIGTAVRSVVQAYAIGLVDDGLNNPMYHNVKRMKEVDLQ